MTPSEENPDAKTPNPEPVRDNRAGRMVVDWSQLRSPKLIALALFLLIGAFYLAWALRYPFGSPREPGYGFFPVVVGAGIVISAAIAIVQQILTGGTDGADTDTEEETDSDMEAVPEDSSNIIWRAGLIIAAMLVYALAANALGHMVSAVIVSSVVIRTTGRRPWWQVLVFGVAIGGVSYLIFTVALGIALPEGLFF